MSDKRAMEAGAVSFSERLANSQVFATLFRDGMALVEETASYLDGSGRQESKKLERSASLVYATESMRLTTRLMQLASWLLLHRAVKEGEMTLAQANKEKSKVRLAACEPGDAKSLALLPAKLQELIARSTKLQAEVRRLDATMHARGGAENRGRQSGRAAMGAVEGGVRIRRLTVPATSSRSPRISSGTATIGRRGRPDAAGRRSRPDATSDRCRDAAYRRACPRSCAW